MQRLSFPSLIFLSTMLACSTTRLSPVPSAITLPPSGELSLPVENPLGARALYLGSTLYRIHGSNEPWTIGTQVSSGCIRMRNEDVIDLYGRVKIGTKVVVI
jgi:lipoprotein-anchoring transpeptidase ErfK/SrfK